MTTVSIERSSPLQSALQQTQLHVTFGAEFQHIDIAEHIGNEEFALQIRNIFVDRKVLVFRKQKLSHSDFIKFSKIFGPLQVHPVTPFKIPGHPEIQVISNIFENGKPIGAGDAGVFWHSDLSWSLTPALATLLYSQEVPEVGGDTLFADQERAYELLTPAMKLRLEGLQAEHYYLAKYEELHKQSPFRKQLTEEQREKTKPVVHPIVRTHPESGRKSLFINEHFTTRIVGLPEAESEALLKELYQHSTAEQFVYRHEWQDNDVVVWDNRSVMHLAGGTPPQYRRKLYRTTTQGSRPMS